MTNNRTAALQLAAIAAGMLMLAFASVPLYRLFCQVTGFGGTTQRIVANSTKIVDQIITVNFDANTDPKLPWKFEPIEKQVKVKLGQNRLVAFRAQNESGSTTKATATYNVTPFAAGRYFSKIQCFCFKEQQLVAGQSANLPVSFYIDPAILNDPETRNVRNITLSYTFFSYESANKSKFRKEP